MCGVCSGVTQQHDNNKLHLSPINQQSLEKQGNKNQHEKRIKILHGIEQRFVRSRSNQLGKVVERIVLAFRIKAHASPATANIPANLLGGMVLAIGVDLVFLLGRRRCKENVQQLPQETAFCIERIRRGFAYGTQQASLACAQCVHRRLQHPVQGPSRHATYTCKDNKEKRIRMRKEHLG